MPQIRRRFNRAQPTTQGPGQQVNPNIFAGEAQATSQLGGAIRQAGGVASDISTRVLQLQQQREYNEALLAYENWITENKDSLASYDDLKNLGNNTSQSFDKFASEHLTKVKNNRAKEKITNLFRFKKNEAIVKVSAAAAKREASAAIVEIPNMIEDFARRAIAAEGNKADTEALKLERMEYFQSLIDTGAQTGSQVSVWQKHLQVRTDEKREEYKKQTKIENTNKFSDLLLSMDESEAAKASTEKFERDQYGLTFDEANAIYKKTSDIRAKRQEIADDAKEKDQIKKEVELSRLDYIDPKTLDQEFDDGNIREEAYKGLSKATIAPLRSDNIAKAKMRRVISQVSLGAITLKAAESKYHELLKDLSISDRDRFSESMYGKSDQYIESTFNNAASILRDKILDKDPFTGNPFGSQAQIDAEAEAEIELDNHILKLYAGERAIDKNTIDSFAINLGANKRREIDANSERQFKQPPFWNNKPKSLEEFKKNLNKLPPKKALEYFKKWSDLL